MNTVTEDTSIETKLDAAREAANVARIALGAASLDGDDPARRKAQLALDDATRTITALESASSVARTRKDTADAEARAEAERQHQQALQAALGRLQAAAERVDVALPALAYPIRELLEAERLVLELAGGPDSPMQWPMKAARFYLLPAIAWATKLPMQGMKLWIDAGDNWRLELPGRQVILSDDDARLAPRYPAPSTE